MLTNTKATRGGETFVMTSRIMTVIINVLAGYSIQLSLLDILIADERYRAAEKRVRRGMDNGGQGRPVAVFGNIMSVADFGLIEKKHGVERTRDALREALGQLYALETYTDRPDRHDWRDESWFRAFSPEEIEADEYLREAFPDFMEG